MIDYIPPDVPPAIVEYAHSIYKEQPSNSTGRWFKYLTVWKGNMEIYLTDWSYKSNKSGSKTENKQFIITGFPNILIYDCHDVRKPTITEARDIYWFMPKYITNSNLKQEHLCHRDIDAFNQHNTPNPYKQKVKYFTPKYVPNPVKEYVNLMYPTSWQPEANERYINFLATYNNQYEVYRVYWTAKESTTNKNIKYVLYDCSNAREYQNDKERIDLILLQSQYNSTARPTFCYSKRK